MRVYLYNGVEGWELRAEVHPKFAVEPPSGWGRSDNCQSGIEGRWTSVYSITLPVIPFRARSWNEEQTLLELKEGHHPVVELEVEDTVLKSHTSSFMPEIWLEEGVRSQFFDLLSAINKKQAEVAEDMVKELFDPYTAKEFQTTETVVPGFRDLGTIISKAGKRYWVKRYLGGRWLFAFAGSDGLVRAPKGLMPHLIGKGGVTAREIKAQTGASRIVEA